MSETNPSLICKQMKLVFARSSSDPRLGFQLQVSDNDQAWRAVSAAHNPLVRGKTFNLYPDQLFKDGENRLLLEGPGGNSFAWKAVISADEDAGWFRFDIEVRSKAGFELSMVDGFEPEIMLDLGPLPPYERGDHVWFITQVTNPTKWNDDAYGNDCPATYYFDPYLKLELMMFFDMTAMSWMSHQNIARFLNYRCGFRRRYAPEPAGEVGLYATGFSGKHFPAGTQHFTYYLSARPRHVPPTDHQALQMLIERCLPLLPPHSLWPVGATSWSDFSHHCAIDLSANQLCWREDDRGHEFILNYVDGYSPAWEQAILARGNKFDMIKPCLDSAVWIAHPLAILRQIDSREPFSSLYGRTLEMIHDMLETGRTLLSTPAADAIDHGAHGSWQYLFGLEEMFQIALFEEDFPLADRIVQQVDRVVIPLAKNSSYLLPLSFNKSTLQRSGSGDAHALLGAYANFMLDLHNYSGAEHYLFEAERAIQTLCRLPINTIHQEVFLLAMGVQAAYRLFSEHGRPDCRGFYHYLLAQTLRMMHWFADRTSPGAQKVNTLGMFQACATISYPAIFENIEVLARLAPTFKVFEPSEALLRIFDHARKNNFYFFPRCFDAGRGELPLQYVPFENIPILEGPAPGSIGQEIYGAGWTFRAHLLWEAFGYAKDREVMILNLDCFEERRQLQTARMNLTFIAFNPTNQPRQTQLLANWARDGASVAMGSSIDTLQVRHVGQQGITLDLDPGAFVFIRISGELLANHSPAARADTASA